MSQQIQKPYLEDKYRAQQEEYEQIESVEVKPQEGTHELSAETEDLLAAIDDVLEVNAQEFVESFRQLSGE